MAHDSDAISTGYPDASGQADDSQQMTLLETLDRVINRGVVITGDIVISVADVDLIYLSLRALLASAATLDRGKDTDVPIIAVQASRK